MSEGLRHALLERVGVAHAFGTRDSKPPADLVRPVQVHGIRVFRAEAGAGAPGEADAIVSSDHSLPVGVVTADCVPILAASTGGRAVAAIHAGWRGLAAGVVAAGIDALRALAPRADLWAAVGPHIGACCYEIDAPVVGPLRERFGDSLEESLQASGPDRPGRWLLDLGRLVVIDLERSGISRAKQGQLRGGCTRCDATRFHSYRRDGAGAGRLVHWVRPGPS